MKMKIVMLLSTSLIIGTLTACSSATSTESTVQPVSEITNAETSAADSESESDPEPVAEESASSDLPTGSDIGTGIMYLSTPGGTTEDGSIPDVLVNDDTSLIQIGMNIKEFDRSIFSFVYIDGVQYSKEQFGDSQATLSLEKDSLKEGKHLVSVVQYDSNDESGDIVTYKEGSYNIVK